MSAAAPTADSGAPPKSKKKLIILISVALLVVLGVGGGLLYVMKQRSAAAAAAEAGDDAPVHAEKEVHRSAPTFVALDPFVVNLADKDVERYAQIGLTLEVDDSKFADEMRAYMPAIRNAILMILAHKSSQELLDRAGKEALAAEIMREAVRPMGIEIDANAPAEGEAKPGAKPRKPAVHNPVRRVHFASFIVQ
jgi:flagellar FliL protein